MPNFQEQLEPNFRYRVGRDARGSITFQIEETMPTFQEQLELLRGLARGDDNSDLEPNEREALRAVLEHYDRMKTALQQLEGYFCKNWAWQGDPDYTDPEFYAAIHPETPEEDHGPTPSE